MSHGRQGPVTTYIIIPGSVLAAALQELLKTVQCPLPIVVDDLWGGE